MFTQCTKCKAIFRVNLREVTIAKGKLRCGECYAVFDATKTLSTTMPAPFQKTVDLETLNWRKIAFYASTWITIGNIYELEAIPNDSLLNALEKETGAKWKTAYI